jgi:hypothetical protein
MTGIGKHLSISPRFNLNTMPGFADAGLLSKFTGLTCMSPDSPIPAYLRLDANLFFANMAVFRGTLLPKVGSALLPSVAPTISAGVVAPTISAGLAPLPPVAPTPSVLPPLEFMKVSGKHKTANHHHTTQSPSQLGFHPEASSES